MEIQAQLQGIAGRVREEMARQEISYYRICQLTGQKRATVKAITAGQSVNITSLLKVAQVLGLQVSLQKAGQKNGQLYSQ